MNLPALNLFLFSSFFLTTFLQLIFISLFIYLFSVVQLYLALFLNWSRYIFLSDGLPDVVMSSQKIHPVMISWNPIIKLDHCRVLMMALSRLVTVDASSAWMMVTHAICVIMLPAPALELSWVCWYFNQHLVSNASHFAWSCLHKASTFQ